MRKVHIGEVSLQDLLDRLAFTEEETASAAMEQGKLFMAAADFRIRRMHRRQTAEMALDNLRVDWSLHLRKKKKGEKGVTERYLNDLVEKSSEVRTAKEEAAKAKRDEEWAKHLLEAYEHRRTALKILAQFAFLEDTSTARHETERLAQKRERLKRALGRDEEDEL